MPKASFNLEEALEWARIAMSQEAPEPIEKWQSKKCYLSRIAAPGPEDDIALLLPKEINQRQSRRAGQDRYCRFEGDDECARLDSRLGLAAKRQLKDRKYDWPLRYLMIQLSYDKEAYPPECRASSLYWRTVRRNLSGEILRLNRTLYPDMCSVHLISYKWELPFYQLTTEHYLHIKKEVSNYLDAWPFREANGFVILMVDAEYCEYSKLYKLHFHGVATGDYPKIINAELRGKRAFLNGKGMPSGVMVHKLDCPAVEVSYALKYAWTYRGIGADEQGQPCKGEKLPRMPEPMQTHYLKLLAQLSPAAGIIMKGVSIKGGRLVVTNP